ncbi:hypothetical protein ACOSP7_013971 [Xanthoceras sorbifolium]
MKVSVTLTELWRRLGRMVLGWMLSRGMQNSLVAARLAVWNREKKRAKNRELRELKEELAGLYGSRSDVTCVKSTTTVIDLENNKQKTNEE